MNLFVPMFKHIFVKLVCFSKSVFKSGSLWYALSHILCYILHPVGFISGIIFTTAHRSDKLLRLCSESVSIFYLKSTLSQQQLFCQPVSLSTYFIKNKPACFNVPTALSYLLVCCQVGTAGTAPFTCAKSDNSPPLWLARETKPLPQPLL